MIPKLIEGAVQLFTAIVNAIPKIIPQLITAVIDLLPTIINSVLSLIPALIKGAFDLFTGIVKAILQIIPQLWDALMALGPKMIGALGQINLWDAGKNIVQGLLDGIASLAGTVGRFFLSLLPGWIVGPFKAALGIHSPSRVFAGFGVNVGQGLVNGIDSMSDDVAKSALGLATAAHDAVDGLSLATTTEVDAAIAAGDGGAVGRRLAALGTGSSQTLNYVNNSGAGLTSEQELVVAARRLQHTH